jgi:8-oxo-dGTP diphosphatase
LALDLPVQEIARLYGGIVRVRACGICILNERVLLVNHKMYEDGSPFWSPPGGGIEFGEPATEAVRREFLEETGLEVQAGKLLFINEHIQPPLHAVELFFEVKAQSEILSKGSDPELTRQIIEEVRFFSMQEISGLPSGHVHAVFGRITSLSDLFKMNSLISLAKEEL